VAVTGTSAKTILHADLDAFFAAVEQRDNPSLRGKPVVVGGGGPNDRGVVSTASYEARKFGIRSAMPLRTAGALCPHAIFVPVNGRKYTEVSRQVMRIFRRFSPLVEQLSIDEAFLDLTGTEALFGTGENAARMLKQAVRDETELTVSVGVASNRLVAKIASDLRKPDGLVVVPDGMEETFVAPLAIERLWGVGAATRKALVEYGVTTIGDLARLPEDVVIRRFGAHGRDLVMRARGVGETVVGNHAEAKSVSQEHTFDVDTADWDVLEQTLLGLSEGVARRLRATNVTCSTISVKIRNSSFETITRQRTLPAATDMGDVIWHAARELTRREVRGQRIRLLGVVASGLNEEQQLALFASEDGADRRRKAIEAADEVRRKFGSRAIGVARLLNASVHEAFERDPRRQPLVDPKQRNDSSDE
jgi:DNA polymerase-4